MHLRLEVLEDLHVRQVKLLPLVNATEIVVNLEGVLVEVPVVVVEQPLDIRGPQLPLPIGEVLQPQLQQQLTHHLHLIVRLPLIVHQDVEVHQQENTHHHRHRQQHQQHHYHRHHPLLPRHRLTAGIYQENALEL